MIFRVVSETWVEAQNATAAAQLVRTVRPSELRVFGPTTPTEFPLIVRFENEEPKNGEA